MRSARPAAFLTGRRALLTRSVVGLVDTPAAETGGNPLDYQVVPNFRVRTIPVLGTLPAIWGLVMATYVLTQLGGSAPRAPWVTPLTIHVPSSTRAPWGHVAPRDINAHAPEPLPC
mmetsp:Transcript_24272/g.76381  ORF Transcript_24272/g.76381 Transcript_24272/m.76381 type:complete len:116 (+) Transcript_24272:805-1152(+)